MQYTTIIELSKQDAIYKLSKKFKNENKKSFCDCKSLICSINRRGKIKIYWKLYPQDMAVGAGSINYDTNKFFVGAIKELDGNRSELVLDFVDNTEKNFKLANFVYAPLVSVFFCAIWLYSIYSEGYHLLFWILTALTTVITFVIAYFSTKPSSDDYDYINDFYQKVKEFLSDRST